MESVLGTSLESSIIYFDPAKKLASEDAILAPIEKNRETWKIIFSTALDDIVWLMSPENIIYCEWKAEPDEDWAEEWLDANIYNEIFKEEFSNYYFVSSDWCWQIEGYSTIALIVLQKAFLDVTISRLIDKDDRTALQMREYKEKWGKVLSRYAIENYLLDKEIVRKFCNANWTQFDEAFYDGQIPDIINVKLKNKVWPLMQKYSSIVDKGIFLRELGKQIIPETSVYQELKAIVFPSEAEIAAISMENSLQQEEGNSLM